MRFCRPSVRQTAGNPASLVRASIQIRKSTKCSGSGSAPGIYMPTWRNESLGVARMTISVLRVIVLTIGIAIVSRAEQPPTSPKHIARQLLGVTSLLSGPAQWAPDGSQILFRSDIGGRRLWGVNPNGDSPKCLAQNVDAELLSWSPDSKWIAYMSAASGYPELWLHSMSDGLEHQLTNLGARINALSWSPDGKWIAFSADRYGVFNIWKVAVPAGTVYRLTAGTSYAINPAWTPDSKQILYVQPDEAWVNHDIAIIPANGWSAKIAGPRS